MTLLLTFVVILLVSLAIVVFATRPKVMQKTVAQRLAMIRSGSVHTDAAQPAIELSDRQRPGFAQQLGEYLERYQFSAKLQLLITHAHSKSTVGSVVATSLTLAIVCGLVMYFVLPLPPLVVAATLIGAGFRYGLLRFQSSRRLKAFNTALPDAIELMTRALRAGHAMNSAIEVVAEQSVEPLASEFAQVFQQQKFGIPFRDALLEMGSRVPSTDLHFLITAVLVQKETGGDLTEILDRTTHVIRERVRIEGEVRVYTAQGRLTGWILGLLPIIMLGLINIVSPGYSHILFYDPVGQKLLYAGGTMIVIGALIIRKVVDIQV